MTGNPVGPVRRRSDRLVVRVVAVTVVTGIVAAAIGVLLVAGLARAALREEVTRRNAEVAEDLAVRFDSRVDAVVESLRVAASGLAATALSDDFHSDDAPADSAASDSAASGSAASGRAVAELRAILSASGSFDELVLFDETGAPVAAAATRFLAEPADYAARPGLLDTASPVAVLDVFPPALEITAPVEFPAGTVRGVLLAVVPAELLAEHIQRPDPRTDAERFLVDGQGRILVHARRDLVAAGERVEQSVLEVVVDEGVADPGPIEVGGTRLLMTASPTRHLDGAVVVRQDEASALAPDTDRVIYLAFVVVATITAIVLAVSLAVRRMLSPLTGLSDAVERLGRGDHRVRTPVTGGEIGAVAERFNTMAEQLDRRHDEVEQMHRLSLLVTSRADREQVVDDIVEAIGGLLRGEAVALLDSGSDDEGPAPARIEASRGELPDPGSVEEIALRCRRRGAMEMESHGDGHLVALPVAGTAGEIHGVLVVRTAGTAPDADEIRLAETFSSFAAAALESVRRLALEQRLVHELEQTIDQRRELIGNVTHDLRVPIVAIQRFGARLASGWREMGPDAVGELVVEIGEQARLLDELVENLLEFTATERGARVLSMVPVPLRVVVAAALDEVGPLLGTRPVDVDVPELEVSADAVLLRRSLVHLLTNAIRYSGHGTPVAITASRVGGEVAIDIVDRGSGMSEEEAVRAFEPFWRRERTAGEGSRTGLGLGLTLVADYVKAMGGSVSVHSEAGRGSTFRITLLPADVS